MICSVVHSTPMSFIICVFEYIWCSMAKTIDMDGQAFVVFIDYSKAFDSIGNKDRWKVGL